MFRNKTLLLPLALVIAGACKASPSGVTGGPDGSTAGADGGTTDNDGGTTNNDYPASGKATIRFKRSERIRNDFAQALSLDKNAVCNELGLYSCTDYVHTIALGGVEPYVLGVLEPLTNTTITTPIAIERVALAACTSRVTADLAAGDNGVVFKGLGLDQNGAIADINAAGIGSSITELYHRALQRDPLAGETQHLKDLYADLAATNEPNPGRDWAILTCFSVMTSMEALFY